MFKSLIRQRVILINDLAFVAKYLVFDSEVPKPNWCKIRTQQEFDAEINATLETLMAASDEGSTIIGFASHGKDFVQACQILQNSNMELQNNLDTLLSCISYNRNANLRSRVDYYNYIMRLYHVIMNNISLIEKEGLLPSTMDEDFKKLASEVSRFDKGRFNQLEEVYVGTFNLVNILANKVEVYLGKMVVHDIVWATEGRNAIRKIIAEQPLEWAPALNDIYYDTRDEFVKYASSIEEKYETAYQG